MSQKQLPDPKQPIYNCLNWMSSHIVYNNYNDDQLLLDAYELLHMAVELKCQQKFIEVLDKLRMRNKRLNAIVEAWKLSSAELSNALSQIEQLRIALSDDAVQIAELQKVIAANSQNA